MLEEALKATLLCVKFDLNDCVLSIFIPPLYYYTLLLAYVYLNKTNPVYNSHINLDEMDNLFV